MIPSFSKVNLNQSVPWGLQSSSKSIMARTCLWAYWDILFTQEFIITIWAVQNVVTNTCDVQADCRVIASEFTCPSKPNDTYCIPIRHLCDSEQDCPFGEDEEGCSEFRCEGFFWCAIDKHEQLDGQLLCFFEQKFSSSFEWQSWIESQMSCLDIQILEFLHLNIPRHSFLSHFWWEYIREKITKLHLHLHLHF